MKERTKNEIAIKRTVDSKTTTVLSVPITEDSTRKFSLMSEDNITLVFETLKPVFFRLGDWIDDELFGQFFITDMAQMPTYDNNSGAYRYNLQFDANYFLWKNKICKYIPDAEAKETSFTLTANIETHLDVIVRNLTSLGFKHNGKNYTVNYTTYNTNNVIDTEKAVLVSYDSISIYDAISAIASAFGCEWWVDGSVIFFGTCLNAGQTVFKLGDNVQDMSRSGTTEKAATRVYFFGSDKNLPKTYRQSDSTPDVTHDGVVQKRLMLPASTYPYGYMQDAEVETEDQAVEKVVTFDDIYPVTRLKVSGISTYTSTKTDDTTKETYTQTFWRVKEDSDFLKNFTKDMIIEGLTLHIVFTSGNMNGMDFECALVTDDSTLGKCFEVVANDTYGRELPDSVLCPKEGDEFCLYNWDATKMSALGLLEKAEQTLADRAVEYFKQSKIDASTYTSTLFSEYAYNGGTFKYFILGDQIKLINGAYFTQVDEDGNHYRISRIIGFEFKLDKPYDSPQYTLGEKPQKTNSMQSMQATVESIKVNGATYINNSGSGSGGGTTVYVIGMADNTVPTDSNVYSARRSDQQFLRRDVDDTANGVLTFKKQDKHSDGLQIGDSFVGGQAGIGGRIDKNANAELESMSLRSFLEAPEYRFNRISISVGNYWRASGGGVIESVTPDTNSDGTTASTGTAILHLEDGEIGHIAVDDICQGIYHDGMTLSNNDTADLDDSYGNFKFAGFFTSYFRITEILESDGVNKKFRYALRNDDDWKAEHHPHALMHFVCYGNFSDKTRQSSRYSTRTYERYLTGVNTWKFTAANIAAQEGDLSNLQVFGLNMTGYSAYYNNIYLSGAIKEIEDLPYRIEFDTHGYDILSFGEVMVLDCYVYKAFTDKTSTVKTWKITRDTGDSAEDAAWLLKDKVKNFSGEITISFTKDENDLSANDNVISTLFTVTAYGEDGAEIATGTLIL